MEADLAVAGVLAWPLMLLFPSMLPGFMQPLIYQGRGLVRSDGGFVEEQPVSAGGGGVANTHYLKTYTGASSDRLLGAVTSADTVLAQTAKTYQLWFRPDVTPGATTRYLLATEKNTAGTTQCFLGIINAPYIYAYCYETGGTVTAVRTTSTQTFNVGTWYHVAATYDPTVGGAATDKIKIYVGGVLKAGTAVANGSGGTMQAPGTSSVNIGGKYASNTANWKHLIDEVRIHNVVLSGAQISSDMSIGYAGDESDLVFLSPYGAGNDFSDTVGSVAMARVETYAVTDNSETLPFA